MEETQSPLSATEEGIGLLDMLVTLAENVKLLIIGPLAVGLCALGISFVLPQTYESVTVLQADQATASLMTTAAVMDPVAANLGMTKDDTVEQARRKLQSTIKAAVGRNDKLLTLTVSAHTAQQAQAIAKAVLQQAYQESRPKANVLARLEAQLAEARVRLKNAQIGTASLARWLKSPTASTGSSELGRGYADLLNITAAAQRQISALETQLEGLNEAQLVQAPTLPQKASQPKKGLLAIGATMATGLVLLLFVFMRQALRNTAANAEAAGKLARIRRLLGLKENLSRARL
ncbi:MAG: Wzz/FepE/Etk N-terminal domain-containing protein [Polaromonas sp.]